MTEAGHSRSARLRKGLVVAQFALTVVIVAATMVAVQQLRYMQTKSLGFDSERLVVMDAEGDLSTLTAELERRPEITAVTTTGYTPGMQGGGGYRYEVNGQRPDEEEERIQTQMVGAGFFDMLDVEVVAGRVPSADRPADLGIGYDRDDTHFFPWWREVPMVINRSTADKFGWTPEEALGQTLRLYIVEGETYYGDYEGPVVGVVEDYHTRSLREAIAPTVFYPTRLRAPGGEDAMFVNATTVLAKAAPGDAAQTMDALAAVWAQVNPQAILDASFLDADLQQLYDAERRVGRVMGAFAGLAVFVACLGLVGLATYTAERRTKEIGIRKALGASVPGIVGLLSKDFLKLVAVAVALGLPVAYLLAERWLEQFAYRISPGVGLFAACTVLVLALAALAVGTQTLRAARTDPAAVLRAE
jgi:putative ABC transport system permease protein